MKTGIIVWSLTLVVPGALALAGPSAWAQTRSDAARPRLIAVASHRVLSPSDASKTAAALAVAGKTVAEKPAVARTASIESAAERILRRLDETFPYKKAGAARPAATRPTGRGGAGTRQVPRASNGAALTSRISLRWPDEIAPWLIIR